MASLIQVLLLGFLLGLRHATDADHVVAVSTIASRERSVRTALWVGVTWGLGHALTVLVAGGAIVLLGIVVPPRLGLGMELSVAVMLIVLGVFNLVGRVRGVHGTNRGTESSHARSGAIATRSTFRSMGVGVLHGLAGSAAVALLVLTSIQGIGAVLAYLAVFGAGTIAGMSLLTSVFALPVAYAAQHFERAHRGLMRFAGALSVAFGLMLAYRIGFVEGLFIGMF